MAEEKKTKKAATKKAASAASGAKGTILQVLGAVVDVKFEEGEVPVFWACGITPQVVVTNAKPDICITHFAAHMLVTDLPSKGSAEVLPKLAEA